MNQRSSDHVRTPPSADVGGAVAIHDSGGGPDDAEQRSGAVTQLGPPHRARGGAFQTLKRTVTEFQEDNLTDRAAALTYYGVLSIFPSLIALVSLVGLLAKPSQVIGTATGLLKGVAPASAIHAFAGPLHSLASNRAGTGIGLIIGVAAAIWSASGYVGAFMRASNKIYEVNEGRSFFRLRPVQLVVTLVLVVLQTTLLLAVALTGPLAANVGAVLGIGSAAVAAWDLAKWPVLAAIVLLMFMILYHASPNAKLGSYRSVLPGAVLGMVAWLVASAAFAFFVANFGSYDKTYGSLAGVIVFLVWLWISNVAVLLGAELNAERERSRELSSGATAARRRIQLDPRSRVKPRQRPRTA